MVVIVDPPSGWMYGYPKEYPGNGEKYRKQLIESGYPKEDLDFAIQNSRYWTSE